VAIVDLHRFVANIKDHVPEHGFHIHDERHYVETCSNRQLWEVDLHPENGCGGPVDVVMSVEAEARTLISFEDEVEKVGHDGDLSEEITVPLSFGFVLPPLDDEPDLLLLATSLAGVGGTELPLQVSANHCYAAVTDKPECTISIVGRVDMPLTQVFKGQDVTCELLERVHDISAFLLERSPGWLLDY